MKKYKALNLYEISNKKKIFSYEWYTTKNKYIIKGFLINNGNRKNILNWILKYATKNLDVTKKILDTETKYIVWLFDIQNNQAIDIMFWKTKGVFEKFNKKITSNKYKNFFEKEFEIKINNSFDENIKIEKNIKDDLFNKENLHTLSWNKKIINELIENKDFSTKDIVKNENEIITVISNLDKNIEKLDKRTLLDITRINYPFAMSLKKKALNILNAKEKKEKRLENLKDY